MQREFKQSSLERAATEPDRERLSGGDCRITRGGDHFLGDNGQRTARVDQRSKRRPPARNRDAQSSPKNRPTERSVRLTEVGVAEDPRVSQDRTRQARRAQGRA